MLPKKTLSAVGVGLGLLATMWVRAPAQQVRIDTSDGQGLAGLVIAAPLPFGTIQSVLARAVHTWMAQVSGIPIQNRLLQPQFSGIAPVLRTTLRGHQGFVTALAFSRDGNWLASGSADRTVRVWELHLGRAQWSLEGHKLPVRSVAFSPDGTTLASGDHGGTIRLWNLWTGELDAEFIGHSHKNTGAVVHSLAFSSDGKTLGSGGGDGTLKLWDVPSAKLLSTIDCQQGAVMAVVFTPDGTTVATGFSRSRVSLWEVTTGQLTKNQRALHNEDGVVVASLPNQPTLALARSKEDVIRLMDAPTRQTIGMFRAHDRGVRALALAPDGRILASGGGDWLVKLWDLELGRIQWAEWFERWQMLQAQERARLDALGKRAIDDKDGAR